MGTSCAANFNRVSTKGGELLCNESKQNPEGGIQRQIIHFGLDPILQMPSNPIFTNITNEFTIAEMAELITLVSLRCQWHL